MKAFFLLLVSMCLTSSIFSQAGELDTSYGDGGFLTLNLPYSYDNTYPASLVADPAGGVYGLVTTEFFLAFYHVVVVHLNNDGSGEEYLEDCSGIQETAYASAIQSNGKLLTLGRGDPYCYTCSSTDDHSIIMRFNEDHTCDTGFGDPVLSCDETECPTGVAYNAFYNEFISYEMRDMVVLTDESILVGGENIAHDDIMIAKLTDNGLNDETFGTGGFVTIAAPGDQYLIKMTPLTSGKVIVSGFYTAPLETESRMMLAKMNANGTLNTSFGTSGFAYSSVSNTGGRSHVITNTGNIFQLGYDLTSDQIIIAKYNANGNLETGFDGDGYAYYKFEDFDTGPGDIILQADGKMLIIGEIYKTGERGVFVLRINADGTIDETFGTDGYFTDTENVRSYSKNNTVITSDNMLTVQAENIDGDVAMFKLSLENPEPCSEAPSGLFATNITTNKAKLNWTADAGALKYKVQYRPLTSPVWITVNATTNLKLITGLAANTTYKYRVRSQ
ncbi:MAG: fibronectin type III domain-containing protein, partial [Chitinophagales bacterium]|nr:fibronectin type III domain-containing protein [Chitinophagales bacterium]